MGGTSASPAASLQSFPAAQDGSKRAGNAQWRSARDPTPATRTRSVFAPGSAAAGLASLGPTVRDDALTNTGVLTAKRAASVSPMESATHPAESATVPPAGGDPSAGSPVSVAPMDTATRLLGPAAVTQDGGPPIAADRAPASWGAPAATQPPAAAIAFGAGGAGHVPRAATAMAPPVPRSPAAATARKGSGGRPASTGAPAPPTAAVLPRMGGAPATLATGDRAARICAQQGPSGCSVHIAVATASPVPAPRWMAPARPVPPAGMGLTAKSRAPRDAMGRTAACLAPAAVEGRLATPRPESAKTAKQASWGPGVSCPVRPAFSGRAASCPASSASMGAVIRCPGRVCARMGSGVPAATRAAWKASMAPTALSGARGARGIHATPSQGSASGVSLSLLSPLFLAPELVVLLGQGSGPAFQWDVRGGYAWPQAGGGALFLGSQRPSLLLPEAHHTGALVAMILAPLLSLLLCLGCWGCCCRPEPQDPRDRAAAMAAAGEGDPMLQVKHQVLGSLRSSLPCFSLGGHKLPRVTVSHHDTEVPFTPSFIEPPSTVWPSDSSWDSEDGDGDEEAPLPAGGDATELQPGFPPEEEGESALNPEPFGIPRTSSLAKAKRPSVSFAQGTRFGPQSLQGSTEPLGATRKPRGAWGRPTPESEEGSQPPPGSQEAGAPLVEDLRTGGCCYENVEAAGSQGEGGCPEPPTSGTPRGVHKARLAGSRHVARRVEALEAASKTPGTPPGLTTIYVTVGKVGVGEGRGESGPGPVQTILKRLGSLQRSRAPPGEDPRPRRALEGFQKPPRRALGAEKGAQRLPGPEKEEEAAQESGTRGPGAGEGQVEAEGPWPLGGEGDGREGVGSPGRPERGSGGAAKAEAKEGEGEPKYENVPGWSGGF
ncbi:scavenger receptor class F member 1 isoform X3 [Sceloporus undulatus]|uniref:scavenger receptor class F member 1 isoform X3 n=1 Tax=Sceloporus undulatus TaxID=8520 RepID=UPI001C4DD44F|nr:scavenger receptor class F member 1 isoform X3 [Sceloporus undulatus]